MINHIRSLKFSEYVSESIANLNTIYVPCYFGQETGEISAAVDLDEIIETVHGVKAADERIILR